MFPQSRNVEPKYSLLDEELQEEHSQVGEDLDDQHGGPRSELRGRNYKIAVVISIILVLCLATACLYAHWIRFRSVHAPGHDNIHCLHPVTRREWRTLPMSQKHNYLQAVHCLKTTESRLGLNQSLYDDFPWLHSRCGEYGELDCSET
jgi:hypothetical protein